MDNVDKSSCVLAERKGIPTILLLECVMFACIYFYSKASEFNTHKVIAIFNVNKLLEYSINMDKSHVNITLYHNDN